ncbi:ABC-type hemin transport system ATPase subunit, partial [Streptacidiphilus sp. MAP12-16]|uniref:ATP-binding protein n=1 Tax=Streptacidiphilus sp. MAP12-16 TaxID=3156300 RepID=UPI0035181568
MTARTDLVERDEELLRLAQLTAGSLRSAGAVGLVIGPVASGKSELLRVLCEDAGKAGVTVLRAVGSQAEHRTPLSIVGQLLQQAPFAAARHREVQRLVEHGVRTAQQTAVIAAPGQEPWPLPTDLVGALCATVFELAEGQPL